MGVWPADEDFAGQRTVDQVWGYLPMTIGGPYALGAYLSRAYRDQIGDPTAAKHAGGTAATAHAFTRRIELRQDQEVVLSSYIWSPSGSTQEGALVGPGVFARIKLGSLADDGTDTVTLDDANCYGFTKNQTAPGQWVYRIYKFVAGVATVLAQSAPEGLSTGAHRAPFDLRLRVTQLTGQVQLRGFVQTFTDQAPVAKLTIIDTSPLDGVDSGAGFALDGEQLFGGNQMVGASASFSVTDSDSFIVDPVGTVQWLDEWARHELSVSKAKTNAFGDSGTLLGVDYSLGSRGSFVVGSPLDSIATDRARTSEFGAPPRDCALMVTGDATLTLTDPSTVFPAPNALAAQLLTIIVAVKLNGAGGVEGDILYSALPLDATNGPGAFIFSIEDSPDIGGQPAVLLRLAVKEPGSSTLADVDSTGFVVAPFLGVVRFFAFSYHEKQVFATDQSLVRFYTGFDGKADIVGAPVATPAGFHSKFPVGSADTHTINAESASAQQVSVYYEILSDEQLDLAFDRYDPLYNSRAVGLATPERLVGQWRFHQNELDSGKRYYHPSMAGQIEGLPTSFHDELNNTFLAGGSDFPHRDDLPALLSLPPIALIFGVRPPVVSEGNHRRLVAKVPAGGALGRVGVIVRRTYITPEGNWTGYRLDVGIGSPAVINVFRMTGHDENGDPREQIIGRQDRHTGAVAFSAGVDTALEFEAYASADGVAVILAAKIGITPVVFVAVSGQATFVDLSGNLVDQSPDRIVNGIGSDGWSAYPIDSAIEYDSWIALAPTQAPGAAASDRTQAITVPREAADPVGSLADLASISWSFAWASTAMRREWPMESGRRRRMLLGTVGRDLLLVTAIGLDEAQSDAFDAFWNAHGVTVPFGVPLATYVRGEQDEVGKFEEDSLRRDTVQRKVNVSFGVWVLRG